MDNDNDKCFLSPKTHRFSYTIRRTKKIMCCSRNDDLTPGVNISIQMGRTVLTLCAQQDPNQAASVVALGPYDVTVTPRNPMNVTPKENVGPSKDTGMEFQVSIPKKPTGLATKTHLIKELCFFFFGAIGGFFLPPFWRIPGIDIHRVRKKT